MRPSILICAVLSFTAVSAGPMFRKRQEGETTTVDNAGGGESTTVIENGDTGSSTSPAGSSPSPPTSPPGSSPSPPASNPNTGEDCPPCTAQGYRTFTSESGKVCYCLGGSTEPWEWSDKRCINDGVGLPNDEGKPYFCLGSGSNPSSRACLSNCNFMLNTVNSLNPCNANLYNAAKSCASCVPGGAIHYQLDGKSLNGPYIMDDSSMNTFMDGMKNWCARPNRCVDLTTGGKISGNGGCPVVAQNNPGTPPIVGGGSTTIRSDGNGSPSVARGGGGGGSVPPKLVTTSTISTTDEQGRPTFTLALATIDNPDFTGNSDFAGVRPTTASDGGGASARTSLSGFSLLFAGIMTMVIFA